MTAWGNLIITMFLVYYTIKVINIIRAGPKNIKYTNQLLDNLRDKKVLTVQEQKQFINLKFGRKLANKQKMNWKSWRNIILYIIMIIVLFTAYRMLINYLEWNISLWIAILFIMVVPVIISFILGKFGLHDNNMLIDLLRRRKIK